MSETPPGIAASAVFARERVVADADLDALGHVNNVVWLRYAIELAEAHAEAVGMGAAALGRRGLAWVVRRHELRYHRAAGPGTRVVGRTWVETMRGARSVRRTRFETASGALLMEACTEWALISLASGRPRRIPPSLVAAFGTVGDEDPRP